MSEDFIELRRDVKAIMTGQLPELYQQLSKIDAAVCRHTEEISGMRKFLQELEHKMEEDLSRPAIQTQMELLKIQNQINLLASEVSKWKSGRDRWVERLLSIMQAVLIAILIWVVQKTLTDAIKLGGS